MSNIQDSAAIIQQHAPGFKPKMAFILGSGLGAVADLLEEVAAIPYTQLPGFPQPSVEGHEGLMRLGHVAGQPVVFLKGRVHLYEGKGFDPLKTMIRTLKTIGVETLFLTNAAGSLIQAFGPGSLIAIADHINLTGTNPLIGDNDDEWGPRFPPMENAWDADLRDLLLRAANTAGVSMGTGVYCQFLGPTFETPAEIAMAKAIGADTVGMSTAVENIVARHCGLKVAGCSAITNYGAGMGDEALSHDQTLEGAKMAEAGMAAVVREFITAYGAQQKAA